MIYGVEKKTAHRSATQHSSRSSGSFTTLWQGENSKPVNANPCLSYVALNQKLRFFTRWQYI